MTRMLLSAVLLGGCVRPKPRVIDPPRREVPRPAEGPHYAVRHGRAALRRCALACYERALRWNPGRFSKGGVVVISWRADRNGDLLSMKFVSDSFRRWEIGSNGDTLADCVVRSVGRRRVRWSRTGVAPMRLHPPPPRLDAGVSDGGAADAAAGDRRSGDAGSDASDAAGEGR